MQKDKLNLTKTDLVIIGGGPAGLSAAIYACIEGTKFLLFEENNIGWFMKEAINSHYYVDGFIGTTKNISGTDLHNSFIAHYKRLGGKFIKEKVVELNKDNKLFFIKTNKRKIFAKTIIITTGTKPKELNIKYSENYKKNIHYYCTKEGHDYINKKVVVLGGRNSGAVAACYLHDIGCRVTLIEKKEKIQAKIKYQNRLKERKIKLITFSEIKELRGNKKLESVIIKRKDKTQFEINTEALFIYIGRVPNLDFLKIKIDCDDNGHVLINSFNQTSIKGLYAAGDTTNKLKQIITACGDGANAFYYVNKYLQKINEF